jgi:acyl-CoA dehydrogenase
MGFLSASIPEEYGGLGLGYLELCIIAEQIGRTIAAVPFSSSVCLAAEFLLAFGSQEQKLAWLPKMANGTAVGTFAGVERKGRLTRASIATQVSNGRINGRKVAVPDGEIADFAIVLARWDAGLSLFLIDLAGEGIERRRVNTIDPSRGHAHLTFENASAQPLGEPGEGWGQVSAILHKAAILTGFEQVGGAERALEMARDYACEREAFGRKIGSFQAIKHMLADIYVATTLARSNAYYGAWALSTGSPDTFLAAAAARVSATVAFQKSSESNIQVHGGIGFTWEHPCHLYYRRANLLAVSLGGLSEWEGRLVDLTYASRQDAS